MRIIPFTSAFLILALSTGTASSMTIYQWVDENGNVVFGDNPNKVEKDKAKEVDIVPLTVIPAFETEEQKKKKEEAEKEAKSGEEEQKEGEDSEEEDEEKFSYKSFKVTSPQNGEAIRANTGNLSVAFDLSPGLKETDTVSVYLDGKKHAEDSKSLVANFENLNRGEHSVFAVVKNKEGDVLLNSDTIRFNVLRHSRLFKK